MEQFLEIAIVIAMLVSIYSVALGTAHRGGRGRWKDPLGRLGKPDSRVVHFVLGAFAVATLLVTGAPQALSATSGAVFGALCGLLNRNRNAVLALDVVGVLAGFVQAGDFLTTPYPVAVGDSLVFRLVLLTLVVMCLVLGMMLHQYIPSSTSTVFTFGAGRGLAFFGLIDAVCFFVSPDGADVLQLGERNFVFYLGFACLSAAVVGLLFSPVTLWVLAAALTIASLMAPGQTRLAGFILGAVVVFVLVRGVVSVIPGGR